MNIKMAHLRTVSLQLDGYFTMLERGIITSQMESMALTRQTNLVQMLMHSISKKQMYLIVMRMLHGDDKIILEMSNKDGNLVYEETVELA